MTPCNAVWADVCRKAALAELRRHAKRFGPTAAIDAALGYRAAVNEFLHANLLTDPELGDAPAAEVIPFPRRDET